MTQPITIDEPQPPRRWTLMLCSVHDGVSVRRPATPDDLRIAGYGHNDTIRELRAALAEVRAELERVKRERDKLLCRGCGAAVWAHFAPDGGGCPADFPDDVHKLVAKLHDAEAAAAKLAEVTRERDPERERLRDAVVEAAEALRATESSPSDTKARWTAKQCLYVALDALRKHEVAK